MKKQFQLLMYTGIMVGAVMSSCKTADSVVLYDANARPNKVYRATGSTASSDGTSRVYKRSGQSNEAVYTAPRSNIAVTTSTSPTELPPVYQNQPASCPYENAPTTQYMPQVVDMTVQNNTQSAYYNQYVQSAQNYGAYNNAQPYNTPRANRHSYQSTNGRNKALDNSLYNRPTAYTLSEDMYTPEYRAMVSGRQNRAYNVQSVQNDPYAGLMTIENGNVVPYNSQPRVVVQQQQIYGQPVYEQPQPQQYVVPVQPQQHYNTEVTQTYAPNAQVYAYSYSQNEVNQADGSYPATLYFKNGAKLTGTLVKIDNTACMFRMSEGRMVNFATKDILKIERR